MKKITAKQLDQRLQQLQLLWIDVPFEQVISWVFNAKLPPHK